MKLKKGLSLVLSLILALQLCLPVVAVGDKPIADPVAGEITCPDSNPEAEIPTVPAEPEAPEAPATPEQPALDPPAEGLGSLTANGAIDISGANNYILIEDDGYTLGAGPKVRHTGDYVLTGSATSTNAPDLSHISVENNVRKPISITLNNVNIQLGSPIICPFSIDEGDVELTLEGKNVLKGGDGSPGLRVEYNRSLTITAESNGSLTAVGGSRAAGIGGRDFFSSGNITMKGGTVIATGGEGGAGIGDGIGIERGGGGKGSFSAPGSAVIIASSISDQRGRDWWSGIFFEGSPIGKIIGSGDLTLTGNITIPSGYTLEMGGWQTLTVPAGKTLTVEGRIYTNGGTVRNLGGNIVYPGNILPRLPTDISNRDISISSCGGSCSGHVITGTTTRNKIIVDGETHDITLVNTDIRSDSTSAFTLRNGAKVNLTLSGNNTLQSAQDYAGLTVRQGTALTITAESSGTLKATGGYYAAGIGGDYVGHYVCQPGTITIQGGTVNAIGGGDAAGIGGGWGGTGGTINIEGGTVTATGGYCGAGIGGGDEGKDGGTINIKGGTVKATGGYYAAGIGGGYEGAGGTINIKKGDVTATSTDDGSAGGGAGIGGGSKGSGGTITIEGGTVKATGSTRSTKGTIYACGGAGIGGGESYHNKDSRITIKGGDVTATGGEMGAGIGGGNEGSGGTIDITGGTVNATGAARGSGIGGGSQRAGGTITITGGDVTAKGIEGAGIGGGSNGAGGTIAISGGTVNATSVKQGAGIGGGQIGPGGTITISGGIVHATGTVAGAGIGGGNGEDGHSLAGSAGTIAIHGGTVYAQGGKRRVTDYRHLGAAGIGGGYTGIGGSVTIDGDAIVFAARGSNAANYIGNSENGKNVTVHRNGGIIFEGDTGTFHSDRVKLESDTTLPSGKTLIIPKDKTLAIPWGKTLTNNGTLFLDGGRITGDDSSINDGEIIGSGTFKTSIVSDDIAEIPDQVYTGKAITPTVTVNSTRGILGKDFTVITDGFTKDYRNNAGIGTAKVVYTRPGYPTAEKGFHIVRSGTTFEGGVKTYKDGAVATTFTYGDTITVKAKPKATGTVATTLALAPDANQMALYLGNTQISDAVDPDSSGVYTMTYNTTGKKLAPGYNAITAKYVGNLTMADAAGDVSVTLLPKALPSATVTSGSRVYDGSRDFASVPLTLTGVIVGDKVTATANGTAASADVGIHAFAASAVTFDGADADYYTLAPAAVSGNVSIDPKSVTVSITAANKVYDGNTNATAAYAVVGTVGKESLTASGGTANFNHKSVGSRTVTATGFTISGGVGTKVGNYALGNTTATTTANITPKPLTWGTFGTVKNKTYNGKADATVDTLPTLTGMVGKETVVANPGTVTFANANAGTDKTVTATDFGITGTHAGNYTAPAGQPTFAKGTITVKEITPTVKVTGTYTFDGKQQIPTFTVKDGVTDIPATDYTVSYGDNINAGDNAGSVTVALRGNYSGHATTNFTIGKATTGNKEISDPITLTAADNKAYSVVLPTSLEGVGTLTYGATTVTSSTIPFAADKEPKADNGKKTLTFTTAGGTAAEQTATVTVTVSTANYRDFTFKLTIQLVAKTGVTLTGLSAAPNLKYNGAQHTGYAGTITATDDSDNAVTGLTYSYRYTGINGTSYSSSNAPTNAGSYSLTVSVANSDPKYIGIHAGISFTIAKAPVTVTAGTYAVTKAWDGTTAAGTPGGALSVLGILKNEATVKATPRSYPLSSVGRHKVDVDLTLSGSGNYVLKNSTVEVPGTITSGAVPKAAPAPDATPVSKSAAAITLQPVAVDGETVEYAKGDDGTTPGTWQDSTTFDNLLPNTEYYFFARVKSNGNHDAGTASTGIAITTEKKSSPLIAPKGMTFPVGKTWESKFTVAELLNEWEHYTGSPLPKDAKFDSVSGPDTGKRNVLERIELKSNELVFKSKNNTDVADEDVFDITVIFDQYETVTFPLTFRNSEKLTATITAKLESKVYDGKAMVKPTPTATSGGAPADLKYTYQWQKDDVSIPGNHAPKDVGNYALVITGENDDSVGSRTISFMIVKRALTITAESKSILSGTDFTADAYKVEGLAENETLDGVAVDCSYKNNDTASSNAGRYPITVTGGTVSGGSDNYAITYVPGTLTVTLDTTALDTAITAAKTAKSGVTVSDQDSNKMTVGVKFVTTAAMEALNAALAGAEASKAGATAKEQIETAAEALNQATETFKAAIQTGASPDSGITRYVITATAGAGGSISPEGTVRVQRGKDKTFTITPNEGYVVADVLVDGASVGAVTSYTFSKVTKPHTISATFRPWTNPYSDVSEKDWFYEAVQTVTQRNLMTGVDKNTFNPYGTATRGTIATVLYRQAGSPAVETDGTKWYSAAQAWGIKEGISDGANMEREITRQELVTMLHRYAKQMKLDISVGEDTNILSYNDAFDLPPWSIPAFQWACGAGIVEGADENLLPNATATRAEVAAMLQRFLTVAAQ